MRFHPAAIVLDPENDASISRPAIIRTGRTPCGQGDGQRIALLCAITQGIFDQVEQDLHHFIFVSANQQVVLDLQLQSAPFLLETWRNFPEHHRHEIGHVHHVPGR